MTDAQETSNNPCPHPTLYARDMRIASVSRMDKPSKSAQRN